MVTGGHVIKDFSITFPNSYQNRIFTSVSSTSNASYSCSTPTGDYSKTGLNISVFNTQSAQNNNGNVFCIVFGT